MASADGADLRQAPEISLAQEIGNRADRSFAHQRRYSRVAADGEEVRFFS
jgi:hypothetical protein